MWLTAKQDQLLTQFAIHNMKNIVGIMFTWYIICLSYIILQV